MYWSNAYTPLAEDAGCDVEILLKDRLEGRRFLTGESPVDVFEDAEIELREQFSFELNGDGVEDWLLWVSAEVRPYAFLSDVESGLYQVSRVDLPVVIDESTYQVLELIYGKTLAWLSFDVEPDPYEGWCSTQDAAGVLWLWRADDSELISIFRNVVCEKRSWDEFFQNGGREIHGWTTDGTQAGGDLIEAVYTWDGVENKYVLTEPSREDLTALWLEAYGGEPTFEMQLDGAAINLRSSLYMADDVETRTAELQSLLNEDVSDISPDVLSRARYIYALALEKLGREDEALAEYIAIYEAAPESAWGKLASLHLERVE